MSNKSALPVKLVAILSSSDFRHRSRLGIAVERSRPSSPAEAEQLPGPVGGDIEVAYLFKQRGQEFKLIK